MASTPGRPHHATLTTLSSFNLLIPYEVGQRPNGLIGDVRLAVRASDCVEQRSGHAPILNDAMTGLSRLDQTEGSRSTLSKWPALLVTRGSDIQPDYIGGRVDEAEGSLHGCGL